MLEYFSLYQILRLGIRENASNNGIGPPIEYDATEIKYDVHESDISTRSIFGPHPSLVDEIVVAPNLAKNGADLWPAAVLTEYCH